jgi:hypothetical protein
MLSINGIACHETGCPDAWREAAIPCFDGIHFFITRAEAEAY